MTKVQTAQVQHFYDMIDIVDPHSEVEVMICTSTKGLSTLWVNIDGACRLRISRIPPGIIKILDEREE